MGLVGPAGLPDAIVHRLNAELTVVLADTGVVERLKTLGTQAHATTPAEFKARLAADIAKWTTVILEAGIERILMWPA